jgi:hypothetical protein
MRRLVYGLAFLGLISAFTGCQSACNECRGCRGGLLHHGGHHGAHGAAGSVNGHHYRPETDPAGGPVPQYAYPYYTIRGPRDFLVDNPPSIGPY